MRSLALVGASAAVIGLAACSHSSSPHAAPASPTHATGKPIVPVSCSQQYRTWMHGEGKDLMGALDAVTSAATDGGARDLKVALKRATPAVARAARHPIPACADPRGYWSVLLMHVNAAVAGTAPKSSVRAAMQDVAEVHHNLMTEVKQAVQ